MAKPWMQEQVPGWPWAERPDFHVHPLDDLVEHELVGDRCMCGPKSVPVTNCAGEQLVMYVHASLDGRELSEQGGRIRREM